MESIVVLTVGWSLFNTDPVCTPFVRDKAKRNATHAAANSFLSGYGRRLEHRRSGRPVAVQVSGESVGGVSITYGGKGGAVAIAASPTIGIDMEPGQSLPDVERLAESTCDPAEYSAAVSAAHPATAFLRIWTRKEAAFKAASIGPSCDPRLVVVGVGGSGWNNIATEFAPSYQGPLHVRTWTFGAAGRFAVLSVAAPCPATVRFGCSPVAAWSSEPFAYNVGESSILTTGPLDFGR